MKELKELVKGSQIILEELKKREPAENEVYSSFNSELKVVYEANDFSLSSSKSTAMYGVRSIVGGRVGFMTTNSADSDALRKIARECQMLAKLAPVSEHQKIASGEAKIGHAEVLDPSLVDLAPKDIYAFAEMIVNEAQRDSRVTIDRVELSWNLSSWALLNSYGYQQTASQALCSWFIMGMAKQGGEVTSFDYDGGGVAKKMQIEGLINESVGRFRESVVGSLGARRGKTYKGKVLLHPAAVMDLIGSLVTFNASAIPHQDGMSSWKDKVGAQVISPALNVYEDPLDQNRIEGWNPFDREGIPSSRHDIILDGVLSFVAHNCFSAHRGGVQPTGNASGGSSSLPRIGFSNLGVVGSGKGAPQLSDEQLLGELKDGLMIKRFAGNQDATSGQFSGVAKNSFWVENGTRAFPVQEVMVAGDLFELAKAVVAVGSVQHQLMGGALAPYILVDGVTVTAG